MGACCMSTELHMQVHLRVDTTLTNNKLDVVAYVARHLTLGDRSTSLAQEFQQVPCEVRTVEVERLGSEFVTTLEHIDHCKLAACHHGAADQGN